MSIRDIFVGSSIVKEIIGKIALSECIHFYPGPNRDVHCTLIEDRIPPGLGRFLNHATKEGMSSLLEMVLQGYACCEGLKVVTLNQLDAEALENTVLNFPACEYNQPFPTLFVELPDSFFQKHEVDCPQDGEVWRGLVAPHRHYPHVVGLRHYKDDQINFIVASVYFTSKQAFTFLLDTSVHSGTLEESIQVSRDPSRQMENSIETTSEEETVSLAALRVALNTVLILESEGMKLLGPANPKHYKQLQENVRKAKKRRDPEEKIEKAEQILRVEPVYYGFDQHVVIYQREDGFENGGGSHESTGRSLRPHWRAGYHRMQHFGIGNLQRKRVRIPPVMVNKHKFLGRSQDTSVTYEIRK